MLNSTLLLTNSAISITSRMTRADHGRGKINDYLKLLNNTIIYGGMYENFE